MYINKKLAKKAKEINPETYDRMRCSMIENELRMFLDENGMPCYPSPDAELAIIRKQLFAILSVLKEKGIDASIPEFQKWFSDAETIKNNVKNILNQ